MFSYVYVDEAGGADDDQSEYVTTALIVAGGVLTSVCSIVAYRCYRLSRRRRWKRRQRQLDADDEPPPPDRVERHAADLHPSEPLLTRSTWTEPMLVAQTEAEMRRLRAERWERDRDARRRLNDTLRCGEVTSTADDQQQPSADHRRQDRHVPGGSRSPRSNGRSPYTSWLDGVGRTQPAATTTTTDDDQPRSAASPVDDGGQDRVLVRGPRSAHSPSTSERRWLNGLGDDVDDDRQRATASPVTGPPSTTAAPRSDTLLSWFDGPASNAQRPAAAATSTKNQSDADDRTTSRSTAAHLRQPPVTSRQHTDDHSAGQQTSSVNQDSDQPSRGHSAVNPHPGTAPDQRRSTSAADRGAPEIDDGLARAQWRQRGDDACADGHHCERDEDTSGVGWSSMTDRVTSDARGSDDDVGYVTGSRDRRRDDDDEAGPTSSSASQQVVFDWDSVDPQLLELCRKTSPVLDPNQYWV